MPIALRFPITLMLSIVCLAAPACVDFQEGMNANERGDYATVLHELRQLAEQGDATAQSNLSLFYSFGQGGSQDFVQAHKWYSHAAANGYKDAATSRDALAKQITPAQIFKAQQLTREWKSNSK